MSRNVCRVRAVCLLSVFKGVSSNPGRHVCVTKKDEIFEVCRSDLSGICGLTASQFLHHTNSWRPKKRQIPELPVFLTLLLKGSAQMS